MSVIDSMSASLLAGSSSVAVGGLASSASGYSSSGLIFNKATNVRDLILNYLNPNVGSYKSKLLDALKANESDDSLKQMEREVYLMFTQTNGCKLSFNNDKITSIYEKIKIYLNGEELIVDLKTLGRLSLLILILRLYEESNVGEKNKCKYYDLISIIDIINCKIYFPLGLNFPFYEHLRKSLIKGEVCDFKSNLFKLNNNCPIKIDDCLTTIEYNAYLDDLTSLNYKKVLVNSINLIPLIGDLKIAGAKSSTTATDSILNLQANAHISMPGTSNIEDRKILYKYSPIGNVENIREKNRKLIDNTRSMRIDNNVTDAEGDENNTGESGGTTGGNNTGGGTTGGNTTGGNTTGGGDATTGGGDANTGGGSTTGGGDATVYDNPNLFIEYGLLYQEILVKLSKKELLQLEPTIIANPRYAVVYYTLLSKLDGVCNIAVPWEITGNEFCLYGNPEASKFVAINKNGEIYNDRTKPILVENLNINRNTMNILDAKVYRIASGLFIYNMNYIVLIQDTGEFTNEPKMVAAEIIENSGYAKDIKIDAKPYTYRGIPIEDICHSSNCNN